MEFWIPFLVVWSIYGVLRYFQIKKFEEAVTDIIKNTEMSINERMDDLVTHLMTDNYVIQNRSETQLQVLKKKKFNWGLGILYMLCFFWPFIIYVIYHMVKTERVRTFNFKTTKTEVAA